MADPLATTTAPIAPAAAPAAAPPSRSIEELLNTPWEKLTPAEQAQVQSWHDTTFLTSNVRAQGPVNEALAAEMQKSQARQLGTNAAISGGMQALQLGLAAIPTAQDTRNAEKKAQLEALEKAGKLGLTGKERQQAEQERFAPVQALAGQRQLEAEAAQSSMGSGTSAEAVLRPQREAAREVSAAALQAGTSISRDNLTKAAQQLQELEQRTAYESERQKALLEQGSKAIGGLAGIVGQVSAGQSVKSLDYEKMKALYPNMTADEWAMLLATRGSGAYQGQNGANIYSMASQYPQVR